jgi:glycine hydroxymethyltransferase
VTLTREQLLESLDRQREALLDSIVLTPVDSLSLSLPERLHTAFLHGLYLSDKTRDREASRNSAILFGGRTEAAGDIAAIHALLSEAFGAAEGSLRLLAGLQAHAATFMSISAAGQGVLLLSEEAGGHFSTQAILHRLGLKTWDIPVDRERLCIDREATIDLVDQRRPDILFVDRSEGLRYEDFAFFGDLDIAVKVFDASQYVTPVLTGRYVNPFSWGFDLILFTLHKSFPGPQKAGIVAREAGEVWSQVTKGLSTLVSSSHAENTYLVGLALLQRELLDEYAERMFDTALELEVQLQRLGVSVIPRSLQGEADWPATHHIWIAANGRDEALEQYESLAAVGIQVNYRTLPYGLGQGLRLGTSFAAAAGLRPEHAERLAAIFASALRGEVTTGLRRRVSELAAEARQTSLVPLGSWALS